MADSEGVIRWLPGKYGTGTLPSSLDGVDGGIRL
jgi:hypothetical protein